MNTVVVIPARYASTRLPGKPLLCETGKPLIQHVVENARRMGGVSMVVVATDDERIRQAVEQFGGRAVMTRADHATGTDRLAEAAGLLGLGDDDIVVNVQGDEPELEPAYVERLVALLAGGEAPMATLAAPLAAAAAENPNNVKVVLDGRGYALYFSRACIPHERDGRGQARRLLHLGVYAYRAGFLRTFAALAHTPAEQAEKLEQLRALEHGYRIAVAVAPAAAPGIDTPADYAAFVGRWQART